MNISIPVPCHEDWNQMKPEDKGRFCLACAKTVTDFTGMTAWEISDFLIQNRSEKICGRFTHSQLAIEYGENIRIVTTHIAQTQWPSVKKMAAVFLFLFILSHPGQAQSVDKKPSNVVSRINEITITKRDSLVTANDTVPSVVAPSQCIGGKLGRVIMTSEKKEKRKTKKIQKAQNLPSVLTGEVAVVAGLVRTD